MKPINLNAMLKAKENLETCEYQLKMANQFKDRWPQDLPKPEEKLEQAKAEYAKAISPVIDALDAVQKRAKTRTIDDWAICQAIKEIEERLDIISSRTDAIGTIAEVDYNAQHFPNAYKYTPESTQITLEKKRNGWTLTYIERNKCKTPANKIVLTLTDATKAHMAERVSKISA